MPFAATGRDPDDATVPRLMTPHILASVELVERPSSPVAAADAPAGGDRATSPEHDDERIATTARSPRFSIVLPTHDRPQLLAEAVASVAAQTLADWELLVVDDASTPAVDASAFGTLPGTLRVIRNATAQGGAGSKAVGAAAARGEYVTFLDDDDLYAPDLLARAAAAFDAHPEFDVFFLGVGWFGADAAAEIADQQPSMQRLLRAAPPQPAAADVWLFDERLLEGLLLAMPMDFQRVVVRRSALARIGEHRRGCLLWDCDWALRAALAARCGLLRGELYRQRADGQAYFSRPGRERAQLESALEMTLRLHRRPPPGTRAHDRALLRAAAGRHAGSLAYFHSHHGPLSSSLAAWWRSQRLRPGAASPKLPLAAVARAALRRLRPHA